MNKKYAHEGANKAICAVNKCMRLTYTRKTRADVFYARFERADTVSVKFSRSTQIGLQSHHMMHSRFVCYRCLKTHRVMANYGVCVTCYGEGRYDDHDVYYDDDHEDDGYEYDYFQEPCPICGNYEICDDDHHREYELSFNGLSSQIQAINCAMCGERLLHSYHVMPDDLFIDKYAVARCSGCLESYFIFHDAEYRITATMRPYGPSVQGFHKSLPVNLPNDDEIPF